MKPIPGVDEGVEERLEALGMELVDIEWAGSGRKPILRLRVDFPDSVPGAGVTVDDCARASRMLEAWLDDHPALPDRYVLEVSSPGVERPLRRKRDFTRFAGQEVAVQVRKQGGGPSSAPVEGVLEGIEEDEGGETDYKVVIEPPEGPKARIARRDIRRAHLVFRWKED
ncbi:MAG: ribosome maturation factor RimP [Gemmatimonadota bacterium]